MLTLAGVAVLAGCSQSPAAYVGRAQSGGDGAVWGSAISSTPTSQPGLRETPAGTSPLADPPGPSGDGQTSGGVGVGSPAPLAPSDTLAPPASVRLAIAPTPTGPADSRAPAGDLATTLASWYGSESGSTTANGDAFDPDGLTAAHRTLPFGTRLVVCTDRCVGVTVTDRGPFVAGRDLDLSRGAFAAIAPLSAGVVEVTWRVA
jgi:rare lipoprotein A